MAMTYYTVTTTVYDSAWSFPAGTARPCNLDRIVAASTDSVESDFDIPTQCCEKRDRDLYTDYFGSLDDARRFVEEAKKA
jgi:hypothetical protein